jgi:SOS-response transcriptional repressor LexA
MDVIERLHAAVKAHGLSKKEVAERANMTASRLSRLVNGRLKRPSLLVIEAVLAAIDKRMEDLYAGASSDDVRQALRVLTEYVDKNQSPEPSVTSGVASIARVHPKKLKSRTVTIYDAAANPNAILLDSGETTRKRIPPELWKRGARRGVRVVGDSMIDAGVRDGDLVFFAPEVDRRVARGKMVVMRVNAAVFLKYYQERNGHKLLLSAKEGLPPMILTSSDDVQLHGIVILPPPLNAGRP